MAAVFDWYAFADYSGAQNVAEQRKRIAWAVDKRDERSSVADLISGLEGGDCEAGGANGLETVANARPGDVPLRVEGAAGETEDIGDAAAAVLLTNADPDVTQGLTRRTLFEAVMELLREAGKRGKRVLFGFDHNYGFPEGFHEAMFGEAPADWRHVLESYAKTVTGDADGDLGKWLPRTWARAANEAVELALGTANGPFWGTRFAGRPGEELYGEHRLQGGTGFRFRERRLVEEQFRRLKPAYQIGGIGTVGQQSLYGIFYLRELLRRCGQEGIRIHVWPQDGLGIPADPGCHVAVEVYPTLCLEEEGIRGPRSDAGDAAASVQWMKRMDEKGQLAELMATEFSPAAWQRIRLEGWVLGVKERLSE